MILWFAKETGNPLGEIGDILGNLGNEYRSQVVNAATAMNPIAWLSMAMGGPTAETAATQGAATMTAGEQYATTAGMTPEQIKAARQSLQALTAPAERGADVLGSATKVTWEYATSKEEEDKFVKQAILAGDEYGALMARTSHIVIKTNGELANASNILAAEQQTATGKTMASAEAWAGLQLRQIRAQFQMAAAQGQRSANSTSPTGSTSRPSRGLSLPQLHLPAAGERPPGTGGQADPVRPVKQKSKFLSIASW